MLNPPKIQESTSPRREAKAADLLPADLVSALNELLDDYETNEAQGVTLGISWSDHCASVAIQWGAAREEVTADTEPASAAKLTIQNVVAEMKRRRSLAETRGMIGRCVEFDSLIQWIEQQMQEAGGHPASPKRPGGSRAVGEQAEQRSETSGVDATLPSNGQLVDAAAPATSGSTLREATVSRLTDEGAP